MPRFLFIVLVSILLFSNIALADTITLNPGWNMFSTIDKTLTVDLIKTTCGTPYPPLTYNSSIKKYNQTNTITPGKGYWIYLTSRCTLNLDTSITVNDIPPLELGWNQIGGPSASVIFNNVKGNCNVVGLPLKYNSTIKKYNTSDTLDPGYGYWVYVKSGCNMGTS
jgi:hypothetical protein